MKKYLLFSMAFLATIVAFASGVDLNHIGTGLSFSMALPVVIDDARNRAVYDRICALFANVDFIAEPSYIRSENVITNAKNTYSFETRSDLLQKQSDRPLQKGVDNNDLFFAAAWGLFLDYRLTTSKAEVTLQTYPNSIAFAAATTGCTYQQLEIFYNSQIQFQVGSTVFYQAYDTQRFRSVPQTQQNAATTAAAGNWSESRLEDNLVTMDPYAILSGAATNKIILTIPALPAVPDVASATADSENVVTLYLTGVTIKNGADDPKIAQALKMAGIWK